jgi:hypothetical protein
MGSIGVAGKSAREPPFPRINLVRKFSFAQCLEQILFVPQHEFVVHARAASNKNVGVFVQKLSVLLFRDGEAATPREENSPKINATVCSL